jgi:hypothetical protein
VSVAFRTREKQQRLAVLDPSNTAHIIIEIFTERRDVGSVRANRIQSRNRVAVPLFVETLLPSGETTGAESGPERVVNASISPLSISAA